MAYDEEFIRRIQKEVSSLYYQEDAMRIAEVHWLDSNQRSGWTSIVPAPAIIKTIGFVIDDDDEAIVISSSVDGDENSMSPVAIPYECVIGVWEIKLS